MIAYRLDASGIERQDLAPFFEGWPTPPSLERRLTAVRGADHAAFAFDGDRLVGFATALSDAYPDPEDASGKYVAVDVAPVKRLPRPVTLAEIKADAAFRDFPLVRIARLSVMPVTDAEWARIEGMAGKAG